MENYINIIFIKIAYITIIFTCITIVATKIKLHKVMFLILAYLGMASVAICLGYEYIGVLLIIIYAGAIIVLIVFVVMILGKPITSKISKLGLIVYFIMSVIILNGYKNYNDISKTNILLKQNDNNIYLMGQSLYTTDSLNFLGCGVLLFVAMIGAIYIIKKI